MTHPRTRIKFCGFTRAEDADAACRLGVDAIGLVLTRKSKRFPGLERAREIRRALPPFVTCVALFMDDEIGFVSRRSLRSRRTCCSSTAAKRRRIVYATVGPT